MGALKNISFTCGIVCILKSYLLGASFSLPPGTPGRLEIIDFFGQIHADVSYQNGKFCEHVIVPGTTCHLYFPVDGSQPDTVDVGKWSGARYGSTGLNNDAVTDWWIRIFGGRQAVTDSYEWRICDLLQEPEMVLDLDGYAVHIIRFTGEKRDFVFRKVFWQAFRLIAADPVGRALLYRLLIEIRRTDDTAIGGCCGDDVEVVDLAERNNCRNIAIIRGREFAFYIRGLVEVNFDTMLTATVLSKNSNGKVTTGQEAIPHDIGLFHEMLHWFHFLRNPDRYTVGGSNDPNVFKYALRCYYGDQNELAIWGGNTDSEEIANVLGAPNCKDVRYQGLIAPDAFLTENPGEATKVIVRGNPQYVPNSDMFLTGDDLSENVYRISRNCHMRFGHCCYEIIAVAFYPMPDRFLLANVLAVNCYQEITGTYINWNLIQGQAIK